jgi:hypothetical protein
VPNVITSLGENRSGRVMKLKHVVIPILLFVLHGCGGGGGGGGSSTPVPSLTTNLPSSAFDDETIVINVSTRNFGTGDKTYNATSNTLTIAEGNADNQFVIDGIYSDPGNHTINFSASDSSGASASLSASIRIDVVPTGVWEVTSLIVDGQSFSDSYMFSTITRGGRVFSYAATLQDDGSYVYEKCLGTQSTSVSNLTFEAWCGDSVDGFQVDEQNYRITGDLNLAGDLASGTYSVYESNGAYLGQADVQLQRFNTHSDQGLTAPQSAAGVFIGAGSSWVAASEANAGVILSIDAAGNITSNSSDGSCVIEGSVAPVNVELNEGNDFVRRGIFDGVPLSQFGCFEAGNFGSGNRNISSGEGILELFPGIYNGGAIDDEELWIYMSESTNSYTGIPSVQIFLRACTASGNPTSYAIFSGRTGLCSN